MLLIDEIDRADEEFEAFLLEFLSRLPGVDSGDRHGGGQEQPPIVVLTSNRSRELSEALKRRCLHLQLDYPDAETELEIVRLKAPGVGRRARGRAGAHRPAAARARAPQGAQHRRDAGLGSGPDRAGRRAPRLTASSSSETLSVIIKYDRDADEGAAALELQRAGARTATRTTHHRHDRGRPRARALQWTGSSRLRRAPAPPPGAGLARRGPRRPRGPAPRRAGRARGSARHPARDADQEHGRRRDLRAPVRPLLRAAARASRPGAPSRPRSRSGRQPPPSCASARTWRGTPTTATTTTRTPAPTPSTCVAS